MVEQSNEQKELFLDIAAAYNNRMRPKRGTTDKEECDTIRAKFAEVLAGVSQNLT